MKLRTKLWMSACAAALLGVSPVSAQEKLPPPGVKPVAPPAPAHGAMAAPNYHYQPACCQPDCCGGHGFSAGAEIVYLRAHVSERDLSGHDYEIGYRVWAGIESDGLGVRVRWFDWDESSPGQGDFNGHEITVVDFEVTSSMDAGGFAFVGSAGLRYAEFTQEDTPTRIFGIDDSYGIVLGGELRRQVCCSGAAYLSVRGALMYGDDVDGDKYQTFTITEIQLGAEWFSDCGLGTIFVRGGVEAQFWAGVSDDDSENFGLFGGFLAVGIRK